MFLDDLMTDQREQVRCVLMQVLTVCAEEDEKNAPPRSLMREIGEKHPECRANPSSYSVPREVGHADGLHDVKID